MPRGRTASLLLPQVCRCFFRTVLSMSCTMPLSADALRGPFSIIFDCLIVRLSVCPVSLR
jgi:hypothetical protein